ncbi:Uncharacterised protein [uncultured Ruminococcus sp.]|nr:Uncharacterised protein [uncultured Ruminococcus sp.]
MVKWKKMNKKMAGLLLGVMMLFTASTTAFAYVDESAEASKVETTQTEQSTDKEEKKDEATNTNEVLPEDGTDKGTAFTTPGNGEVKDDITDDSTKEFLTVTTKNNNTFYIVIDRSATSQNVYMLSQIDENDLSEFLDKDSTATVVTPQPDKSIVVWSIGRGFSINVLCGNSISFPKILFSCKTSFGKITISPEQAVSDEHNSPFVGTHISVIFIFSFSDILITSLKCNVPLYIRT